MGYEATALEDVGGVVSLFLVRRPHHRLAVAAREGGGRSPVHHDRDGNHHTDDAKQEF